MDINELKESMHKGPVAFSYRKADGTIREAVGTLMPELIPQPAAQLSAEQPAEKKPRKQNPDICCYYDLSEGHVGWRSFKIASLIS